MILETRKLITIALLALALTAGPDLARAADASQQVEVWHDSGLVFVVRDAQGHILSHARGHLEKWVSETQMIWVVRDAEGRFITYARGQIETWKDGSRHVVLRNHDGKFIAVGPASTPGQAMLVQEPHPEDVMKVLAVY